jgi:hypothetical protein
MKGYEKILSPGWGGCDKPTLRVEILKSFPSLMGGGRIFLFVSKETKRIGLTQVEAGGLYLWDSNRPLCDGGVESISREEASRLMEN